MRLGSLVTFSQSSVGFARRVFANVIGMVQVDVTVEGGRVDACGVFIVAFRSAKGFLPFLGPFAERKATLNRLRSVTCESAQFASLAARHVVGFARRAFAHLVGMVRVDVTVEGRRVDACGIFIVAFRSAKGFLLSDGPFAERKATLNRLRRYLRFAPIEPRHVVGFARRAFANLVGMVQVDVTVKGGRPDARGVSIVAFRSAKGFLLSDGPFAERKATINRVRRHLRNAQMEPHHVVGFARRAVANLVGMVQVDVTVEGGRVAARGVFIVAFRSAKGFLLSDGPFAERKATINGVRRYLRNAPIERRLVVGFARRAFANVVGMVQVHVTVEGGWADACGVSIVAFRSAKGFLLSDEPFAERKATMNRVHRYLRNAQIERRHVIGFARRAFANVVGMVQVTSQSKVAGLTPAASP